MRKQVEESISKIRPYLGASIVELVEVADGAVKVRIIPCHCSAGNPLYSIPEDVIVSLLQEQLEEDVPEINEVMAVP